VPKESRSGGAAERNGVSDAFLEQAPGCHWIVDQRQVFVRVYGDALPIFGKSSAELTGMPVSDVFRGDAQTTWKDRIGRVLKGETLTLRERRGETVWNVSLFPVRAGSGEPHAGGSATEARVWAEAEQALRYTVLGALKAQQFERAMVSKFLHDAVGQNLTAFGLQLDLIRMDLEADSPEQCARIAEVQRLLEEMMEKVRLYSYELNPSTVERAGLRTALDLLAARIGERFNGSLRMNVDPSLKIDKKVAAAMYHIAKEAAENAVQHGSCSTIEIAVKSSRTGTFLEVRDNGRGFDPADVAAGCRGLGLLSMEHYAAEAGLDLSIASQYGKGTIVRAAEPGAV
jgi:two-component system NarL family sensor kinase